MALLSRYIIILYRISLRSIILLLEYSVS